MHGIHIGELIVCIVGDVCNQIGFRYTKGSYMIHLLRADLAKIQSDPQVFVLGAPNRVPIRHLGSDLIYFQ